MLEPSLFEKKLLEFHQSWNLERIKNMSIDEYADLSNPDSFCYWLEYRTKELGAIGGIALHKFEIWKTKSNKVLRNHFKYENGYYFNSLKGESLNEVFKLIKKQIIEIVINAEKLNWEALEQIKFNSIAKWKIAFLFSNNKILPIYSKRALIAIANGLENNFFDFKTSISTLQKHILSFKKDNESLEDFASKNYVFFATKNRINFIERVVIKEEFDNDLLLQNTIVKLNKALNKKTNEYIFETSVLQENIINQQKYVYDIVIKKNNNPIAVVELKEKEISKEEVINEIKSIPIYCKYILIVDKNNSVVYDRHKNQIISENYELNELLSLFDKKIDTSEIEELKKEYAISLLKFLKEFNPHKNFNNDLNKKELNISLNDLIKNIDFNLEKNTLNFITSDYQIEEKIFDYLLPDIESKKNSIYRYTTLDTLYKIIDTNKYRINGIRSMNDQSDGVLIDKLITPYSNFEDDETVRELNKKYVSSCSLLEDNLTMWRLYGDNSKGVCIELELKNNNSHSNFFIKTINYVNDENVDVINLFKKVFVYFIDKGINFKFKWLDAFKLFFKVADYKVEKEVRILFVNHDNYKRNWMLAQPFGIISPFVEFDLLIKSENIYSENEELPFRIKKIIIGPNCPYKEKNIGQLKDLLNEKKFNRVNVIPSKIKSDTYIV